MIKDKNTNEGERVQQTLSTYSHGKTSGKNLEKSIQNFVTKLLP